MIPGGSKWLVAIVAITSLICLATMVMLLQSYWAARFSRFDVDPSGLHVRGNWYGRHIPPEQIDGSGVRVVDLTREQEFAPRLRTFGVSLPGYRSGWFRLANGRKALLHLTDETHVVHVPTFQGYSLLLSTPEPERLAASLRRLTAESVHQATQPAP